jgi:probable HAF family extracellular repeat protein
MRIGKFGMKKKRFIILLLCVVVLVVGILIVVLWPKQPILYRVTYLPSLGGQVTLPCTINDNGQIAGLSQDKNRTSHLFLWDREKEMQDMGPVINDYVYINNAGQIAATMHDPNGNKRAFIQDSNSIRHILTTLGGKTSTAQGINNHGQVVGTAETASGILHSFVWDAVNGIRDLTASSNKQTRAFSINDVGQVIVYAQGGQRLVDVNDGLTSSSQLSPVLIFEGARSINNKGFIAGCINIGLNKYNIVIWHPDFGIKSLYKHKKDLPAFLKINDVNQVVFYTRKKAFTLFGRTLFTSANKNYLYDPNLGRISLNGYVSTSRGEVFCLTDINNKGRIIGYIRSTKDSHSRGILLEPIPEKWNKE